MKKAGEISRFQGAVLQENSIRQGQLPCQVKSLHVAKCFIYKRIVEGLLRRSPEAELGQEAAEFGDAGNLLRFAGVE